ncbi:hypothetical protein NIE88_18640 [Sporolactobacillus shoreicorticis]|uniref:DNA-binding protein n=1 Tax=Sporolactobacillus shoreicorticis TaxID=1923877 RepID=A0ABW5S6L1_9BACL|nr:hypothetical protein [Sporolactobacillus shoreicorticis]MCO7127767.1 hypothetical protein [Sporolactobacillus shoreicorticis]
MPSIEDSIKLAVHEAVAPLVEEIKFLRERVDRQYPPTVPTKVAAQMMSVGITRMYEIAHDPEFYPAIWSNKEKRSGRVVFSSEGILQWIREHTQVA